MLQLKIEKEVETKHTVIRGKDWDIRQTACILAVGLIVALFWWLAGLDIVGIVIVSVPFGYLAYLIGWKEEAGLKIEDLLVKYVQTKMYKNTKRGYHTRNGYVDLMNKAYTKLRNKDLADKKTAKMVEARAKKEANRKSSVKYKSYA